MSSVSSTPDASTSVLSSKRRKLDRSPDDINPLPYPFPLPKHYRADVEVALTSKKMNTETTSAFLSSIASSMLVHKKYPTRNDYINVARTVVEKYDFMGTQFVEGTPYVSVYRACFLSDLILIFIYVARDRYISD